MLEKQKSNFLWWFLFQYKNPLQHYNYLLTIRLFLVTFFENILINPQFAPLFLQTPTIPGPTFFLATLPCLRNVIKDSKVYNPAKASENGLVTFFWGIIKWYDKESGFIFCSLKLPFIHVFDCLLDDFPQSNCIKIISKTAKNSDLMT